MTLTEYIKNLKNLKNEISKVIKNLKSKTPSYDYDILSLKEEAFECAKILNECDLKHESNTSKSENIKKQLKLRKKSFIEKKY